MFKGSYNAPLLQEQGWYLVIFYTPDRSCNLMLVQIISSSHWLLSETDLSAGNKSGSYIFLHDICHIFLMSGHNFTSRYHFYYHDWESKNYFLARISILLLRSN